MNIPVSILNYRSSRISDHIARCLTWKDDVTPDEKAFKVLKAVLAAGVNVWNGADVYGTPDNNSLHLMNRYFNIFPEDADKVVLTIKSGIKDMRISTMDFDALAELVKEGKIGGTQLSEVSANTIRRAAKGGKDRYGGSGNQLVGDICLRDGVAETCAELGIPMVAYTPLGGGMLTGQIKSLADMPANDYHRFFPRFQPENFEMNLQLVIKLEEMAAKKLCTTAQLALSWIKAQSRRDGMPVIVPVAGARSEQRVLENVTDIPLSEEYMAEIKAILDKFAVAGDRYPPAAAKLTEY
ncbi:aldo/keto reductase [Penicillium subrubescens]|uniref:aldo/keto reductase n=1 Tax=Penicillium subrubescens TaxID=1316194 RepID=UPI0025457936|nr:aldo/keto reductase [Penicillium subrubescens]KAJ5891531.1 aldo/keto reductase [Penicillium subrubescens]